MFNLRCLLKTATIFLFAFNFCVSQAFAANEMIQNGDFSNGMSGWEYWAQGGTNADFEVDDFNELARWDILDGGDNFWSLQLNQTGLAIQQGKTYELSFDAGMIGSFSSGELSVTVEKSSPGWDHYMPRKTVTLTQTATTYTYRFTMQQATDWWARLVFHLGTNQGSAPFAKIIQIDNVSLKELPPNLIQNGDFSAGMWSWATYLHESTDATIEVSSYNDVRANIVEGGSESWHVQLSQAGLAIEQGKTYRVSFATTTSSKSASGNIEVVVEEAFSDWTHYSDVQVVEANPGNQYISFEFTMDEPSDYNARLTFNFGNNDGPEPGPSANIWVDNVEIREAW